MGIVSYILAIAMKKNVSLGISNNWKNIAKIVYLPYLKGHVINLICIIYSKPKKSISSNNYLSDGMQYSILNNLSKSILQVDTICWSEIC